MLQSVKILLFTLPLLQAVLQQPYCGTLCGPNAECVAENKCKCNLGFSSVFSQDTGLAYCKAICDIPCGEYRSCVAPNECECVAGYEEVAQQCVPKCENGCAHGKCVAPDECVCDEGYIKNKHESCVVPLTSSTSGIEQGSMTQTTFFTETTTIVAETTTQVPSEHVYVESNTQSIVDADADFRCADDQVYAKGACRTIIDKACSAELCRPHAHCDEADQCVCDDGFEWYESRLTRKMRCLAQADVEHVGVLFHPHHNRSRTLFNAITAIGVSCMLVALLVLLFGCFLPKRGA